MGISLFDELKEEEENKANPRSGISLLSQIPVDRAQQVETIFNIEQSDIRREEAAKLSSDVQNLNGLQKFIVGAGRGLTTIGRATGLVNQESDFIKKTFKEQEGIAGVAGEVVGEAAPFLIPGVGVSGIASTAGRVLASTALGAVEGGAIVKGKGGDLTETLAGSGAGGILAGSIETIFPVLGRLGSALFTSLGVKAKGPLLTPEGSPTPEFQDVLEKTGTSFDELTQKAIDFVDTQSKLVDPEEVARAARFESQGIPATKGDVTQEFNQQATEQRLLSITGDEASEPLRQLKLEQSQAFESSVNELIDSLGVPSNTGDTIKDALITDKKLITSEKNKLYKEMAENSPDVQNAPVFTDTIREAIPDKKTLRRISRIQGNQVDAVNDLLVEFGIDKTPDAVAEFMESGGEVIPLNFGNFEEFRQAINAIERADTTGATKVVTGGIKRALDAEGELLDSALNSAGIIEESVLAASKQARGKVRQLKTEFSPESVVGKLIDVKRDGVTPITEASKVANKLLAKNAPIEDLERTLKVLGRSGAKGKQGIRDLQASVVLNALENSLKASSRKTGGVQTVGGNQFAKSLTDFGDDKLDLLFSGNPKDLEKLRGLKQTALDITPSAAATPKGSAPVLLDLAKRAGRLPGLAALVDIVGFVVKAGGDDRAVRKALNAKPEAKRLATVIDQVFPTLAVALGVSGVTKKEENK